ncbi:MAG: hypothetical protein ACM3JD_08020 [Rudaea sp.]
MYRIKLVLGAVLAAIIAAVLTINIFDLTTPPRDIDALLRPSPSPTGAPTIPTLWTPIPMDTPTPGALTLLLSDDFSRPGNWPRGGGFGYASGGYVITPPSGTSFLAIPLSTIQDKTLTSISIQVEARPESSQAVEYGVFFWHSTDSQGRERFLSFTITPGRGFRLSAYRPATTGTGARLQRTDIVPETPVRYVNAGATANLLRIEVEPGRFRAFINDFPVLDRTNPDIDAYLDRPGFDGGVGMIALRPASGSAGARFIQFDLYDLSRG